MGRKLNLSKIKVDANGEVIEKFCVRHNQGEGAWIAASEFNKAKGLVGGLANICRTCKYELMSNTEEKKTKLRESAKTWAAENPEKVKEKNERHNVRRRLAALDRREQEAREFLSTVVMEREKLLRELGCISD